MTGSAEDLPDLKRLYRTLRLIRRVEEEVARIYPTDKIKSPVHLSIGQEAVAAGICDALLPDDVVSPTYRCHAAYLAKGGDPRAMMAELYGKDAGCARGKGGSMHMIGMDRWVLGASAVVGTTLAVAAGYALALKWEGQGRIVAAFIGDGATEEGVFHETLNFAALHRLPLLVVCENNGYAIHTPIEKRWSTKLLCERVRTYGMPADRIESGDVLELRSKAAERIAVMRTGGGPAFMECLTYRWKEHVGPGEDYDAGYRTREELVEWQSRDSVARIAAMLANEERSAIDAAVEKEIAEATEFAETAEWPRAEELYRHVYAE
jgi:pyruvate dehydrogenase E1 component alpha subunit